MAWSAIINNVRDEQTADGQQRLVVNVTFTDGVSRKVASDMIFHAVTKDAVFNAIQGKIESYNASDTAKPDIPIGPFVYEAKQPTPEEQARLNYAKDLRLFSQMNQAILAEVKTNVDQDYVELKKRVHDDFIDSYIDLF